MFIQRNEEHGIIDIYPYDDAQPFAARVTVNTRRLDPTDGIFVNDPRIRFDSGSQMTPSDARTYAKAILKSCDLAEAER